MFGDLIQQEQPSQEKTELENQIERILSSPELDLQSFRLRHSGATNIRWLQNQEFCEVGVGAIGGTKVPFQIDLGLEKGTLVDPDGVEFHNLSSQGYDLVHLGMPKVKALQEKIFRHSGIKLDIKEEKVEHEDCQKILSTYDIVSLNVDNMDIRNRFWHGLAEMCNYNIPNSLPELIIDSRMTLGTYTTIILPVRKMAQISGDWAYSKINEIISDHCFSDEEGLQEDCAARTIIYTVTHISSYICAFLDWYSREGNIENLKGMFDNQSNIPFKTVYSFDVRSWTALTKSKSELRLRDQVSELVEENEKLKRVVTELSRKPKEEKPSDLNIQPDFERTYSVVTKDGFRISGLLFDVDDYYVKICTYCDVIGHKYYYIPKERITQCIADSSDPSSEELKIIFNKLLPPEVKNPEITIEDLRYSEYLVLWDTYTIEVTWYEEELNGGIKRLTPIIFYSEGREITQSDFTVIRPLSLEERIKQTGGNQFTISIGDIIVNGDNEVTYTVVSSDERFVTIRNNDREEININHQQLIDGMHNGTFRIIR